MTGAQGLTLHVQEYSNKFNFIQLIRFLEAVIGGDVKAGNLE